MDAVLEFQNRRRKTWRLTWPWLAVGVLGAVITAFVGVEGGSSWQSWTVHAGLMVVFGSLIARAAQIANAHYRCPNCEHVLASFEGFTLNPAACPNCGARLK